MKQRQPIVAGQFYPSDEKQCLAELEQCLTERPIPENLPDKISAAIVPHAGWVFSGSIAALAFNCIKSQNEKVETFILFGAAHSSLPQPVIYDKGLWKSPLGTIEINEMIAESIIGNIPDVIANRRAHAYEHSIEVQIPFIQYLFPKASVVPVIVPPTTQAVEIGMQIGKMIASSDLDIVCIGSTDLTHYGPRYGFNPEGTGPAGIEWAKDVNDQSFIEKALNLEAENLLADALQKSNACGPGAAAATIAAAKAEGVSRGKLLVHSSSDDVMKQKFNQTSDESVGYASIVY